MIYIIYMRNIPYDAPGLQPRRPSPFALLPFAPSPFTASCRRPPPSRCRPLPYPLSASLSQPRCPLRHAQALPRRPPPSRCRPLPYLCPLPYHSPAVPRRSPSRRSLSRLLPRPAAARLRPVAAHYLISVRFPITAPPSLAVRSLAFHRVLPPPASVPLPPITLSLSVSPSRPHRPRRSSLAIYRVPPPPASVPLPPIILSLSVSLSQSHRPPPPMLAPTMPCDAQIPRMPFVARSVRSGTPRRFPAALLSPHPSPAKFPCHLAAAGGIVV